MAREIRNVDSDFAVNRLKNQTGTAEGGQIPPPLRGGTRIPVVSNFRILSRVSYNGGTQFSLAFQQPTLNDSSTQISGYTVYVQSIVSGNALVAQNPTIVQSSPAIIRVDGLEATRVVFTIQTMLQNGQCSLRDRSPSCASSILAPVIEPSDIPISTLTDLNVVLGYNNLTTNGGVAYQTTTGTIGQAATQFFWSEANSRLGLLTSSPLSTFDNRGSFAPGAISNQTANFTAGTALIYTIDATSGNVTVTLPSAATTTGRWYIFKRTDSSTNTVTIGSRVLTENQTLFLYSDGSAWNSLLNGFGV